MKTLTTGIAGVAVFLGLVGCSRNAQNTVPGVGKEAAQQAAVTRPAEPVRGFARGVHLVPGLGPISLRAGQQTFAAGVTFGNAAPYEGIKQSAQGGPASEAKLPIEAVGGDGRKIAGPAPVSIQAGEELTVFATGVPGDVALLPFKPRTYGAEKAKAKIAFIHAAKALPAAAVKVDGKTFRRSVRFGVATDYAVLTPGRHLMQIEYDKSLPPAVASVEQPVVITQDDLGNVLDVTQAPPTTTVIPQKALVTLKQEMDLLSGKVYEVVLFQGANRAPHLRLLEDRFADDLVKAKPAEQ